MNDHMQHRGKLFAITIEPDSYYGAPWDEHDGHGPVTAWTTRSKHPGELVLNNHRIARRYYNFAEACRIARRDGWDAEPCNAGTETKRQQAAKAERADFEYLRRWSNDEWHWVVLTVELLDAEGEPTGAMQSLGGLESDDEDYIRESAHELAEEILTEIEAAEAEQAQTRVASAALIDAYGV